MMQARIVLAAAEDESDTELAQPLGLRITTRWAFAGHSTTRAQKSGSKGWYLTA
jgi:hypothetical protein